MSWILFGLVIIISLGIGLTFIGNYSKTLTTLELILTATTVGLTAWMLLLYTTAFFHVRWISLVTVILLSFYGFYKHLQSLQFTLLVRPLWLTITMLVGVAAQLFLIAPSGWHYTDGIRFYGVNAHDALWHVTLMQTLSKSLPITMPTFSGIQLKGYHFLVDLLGSELVSVFHLSALDLVFRQLPLLFAFMTGLGIYALIKRITSSQIAQFAGVFLSFFGGSFGFILGGRETTFWAQQSISTFVNLPLGASFAIIICLLILFRLWIESKQNQILWVTALLVGSLIGIKAYGGLLVLNAFVSSLGLYALLQRKVSLIWPILFSIVITSFLLLTNIDWHKSAFVFEPGWFLKTMMEAPDRVNFPQWELLRQTYLVEHNYPRLLFLWVIAVLIFFIGNMGPRIVGLLYPFTMKQFKKYWLLNVFLFLLFGAGLVVPLLFIQSGVVWNAIQFFYYSLFVMNLLAALSIAAVKNKLVAMLMTGLMVIVSLPTTYQVLREYALKYSAGKVDLLINQDQLEALNYLQSQPIATILAPYNDDSYISAFSGKDVYFADQTQADLLGFTDVLRRKQQLNDIFCGSMKEEEIKAIMEQNSLNYIYVDTHSECQRHDFGSMDFLKEVKIKNTVSVYQYL